MLTINANLVSLCNYMLKMRLQRVGRKNDPSFRVVVTDSRSGPKSNKQVDTLGSYSAKTNLFKIDGDRAKEWITKGVQVSPTVHNLMVTNKIVEGKKINVLPNKSPIVDEEKLKAEAEAKAKAEEEAKAAAEAPAEEVAETPAEETPTPEEAPAEEAAPTEETAEAK